MNTNTYSTHNYFMNFIGTARIQKYLFHIFLLFLRRIMEKLAFFLMVKEGSVYM